MHLRESVYGDLKAMLAERIESVLKRIVDSYWNDKWYMLTERDLVARAFSLLRKELLPRFSIHCELRPFKGPYTQEDKKWYKVIRDVEGIAKWCRQQGNSGAIFDLCVLDSDPELWRKAYKKACGERTEPRYWRFPSYPLEAFRAVIEFKVRGKGNLPRIKKDIRKLGEMCPVDGNCDGFLILLDRCATVGLVEEVRDAVNKLKRVSFRGPRNIMDGS